MKQICILFISLLSCFATRAQDLITAKNGDRITARVLKIGDKEIEYKLYDNPDGPTHTLSISEIVVINYANGKSDSFGSTNTDEDGSLAAQGTADAKKYYKARGVAVGTGLSALYAPYGLIATAIVSSVRPKYDHLNFPDSRLMEQPSYRNAYEQKAFKIKKGKAWGGFGIGIGIAASLVAGILIASYNPGY